MNKAATERAVTKLTGCESFKANFILRWLPDGEFAALVKEAQDGKANAVRMRPAIRGPERIKWLQEVETALKTRHETVEGDDQKDKALRALLSVGQEIRSEETHYENLKQAQARRSLARFVRGLVAFARAKYGDRLPSILEYLKGVGANIDAVMDGRDLQGLEAEGT